MVTQRRPDRLRGQARTAGPQGQPGAALRHRPRWRRGATPGQRGHRRGSLRLVPRRQAHRLRLLGLARAERRQGAGEGFQGLQGTQGKRLCHQPGAVPPLGQPPADGPRAAPAGDGRGHRPRARPVRGQPLRIGAQRSRPPCLRHLTRRPAHRLRFRHRRRKARGQLLRTGRDRVEEPTRARTGARCRLGHGCAALQPRGLGHRLPRQPPRPQAHHAGPAVPVGARQRPMVGAKRRVGPRGACAAALGRRWPGAALHGRAEGPPAPLALRPARPARRGGGREAARSAVSTSAPARW